MVGCLPRPWLHLICIYLSIAQGDKACEHGKPAAKGLAPAPACITQPRRHRTLHPPPTAAFKKLLSLRSVLHRCHTARLNHWV